MKPGNKDSYKSLSDLEINGKNYKYYSLKKAELNGLEGISKLPKSLKVLLENLLRYEDDISVNKKQIGSDRLCNAVGINDNKNNYIIVDFGTATTFDVIIKNNYLGGVIAPGVLLSLNTLTSKASLIPSIKLKRVKNILGKTTISAVRSGFYWGYIGLVENIIDKISKHTKKKYKLILTGGYSHLFIKSIKQKAHIDKDITIKGLLKITKLL